MSILYKYIYPINTKCHIIFWFFYFILNFIRWGAYFSNYHYSFFSNLLEFSIHIPLVYIHIFFLIPRYILDKKYKLYFLYLILSLLIVYLLKTILTYFFITKNFWPEANIDYNFFDFNHILAVIIGEIYVLSVCCCIFFTVVWVKQRESYENLEKKQLQAKLDYLKMQIQPHFFFNTLNNIYSLSLQKSDKVPDVILKLSHIMEYVLYDIKHIYKINIIKELKYIENYIEIEKLRLDKYDIQFKIEDSIENLYVAPLIFISFIENAFKHGEISDLKLKIIIKVENNKIIFKVINNFVSLNFNKKTSRIGLKNTIERLRIIYSDNFSYKVNIKMNFYIVELQIPKSL